MALNLLTPNQFGLGSSNLFASTAGFGSNSYAATAATGGFGGISPYGLGAGGLYGGGAAANLLQDRSFMQAFDSLANGFVALMSVAMGDIPSAASSKEGGGEDASSADWQAQGAQALN